jgi:hypothetical protein
VQAARVVEEDEVETGTVAVEPSTLSLNRPTPLALADVTPRGRASVLDLSFDDETQARPVDDRLLDTMRRDVMPATDLGVAYESLPSLEARGPFDSFERSRSEASPSPATERYEDSSEGEPWGSREGSGPRERPQALAAQAYSTMPPCSEEGFDEPVIPLAPRLPDELRSEFVRGVQPLRTPTPEAWAPVRSHSSMPAAPPAGPSYAAAPSYAAGPSYAAAPSYAGQSYAGPSPMPAAPPYFPANASYPPGHPLSHYVPGQLHPTPAPSYASGPYARLAPQDAANRAQPVGPQLMAPPSQASKVGRFAWFVAGAAFGITFAFFATGFFSGVRSADLRVASPLPAATQIAPAVPAVAVAPPVAQAPVVQAPPVAQALVAPPVAQALVAPPVAPPVAQALVAPPSAQALVAPPSAPPAVTGTFASPGLLPPAPANVASRAPAQPQRAAMRASYSRRAVAPAQPSGPRPLPGSGETEAPAAPSGGGGANMSDLLGAGLNP